MRWVQSIKTSHNEEARKLYEELLQVTKGESDHPDFDSYISEVKWDFDSPLSIDDFDLLSPNGILQKIIELKDKKDRFDRPFADGLSRTFEEYVVKEPVKCSALLDDLPKLPTAYISSYFDAYTKCWLEAKFVPVEELLSFSKRLFCSENFCADLKNKDSKARWVATSIFRFICAGVRADEKAFAPNLNNKCYEILKAAVQVVHPDPDYSNSSDALTRAINEPRGVLFETSILLALRQARLSYNEEEKLIEREDDFENAWLDLLNLISPPLKSQNKNEASLHAHIGSLYRQLLFLNKDWLYQNIDLVCPPSTSAPELWSAYIQGYCHVSVYNKDMYTILNERGYLLDFLRKENSENQGSRINTLQEHIIDLAIISCLLKDESFEVSLLKKLIDERIPEEWNRIIRSLPRLLGKKSDIEIFGSGKNIISYLLEKFNSTSDKESLKRHLEGVGWLLDIFEDPNDPTVKLIINIAVYFRKEHWDHYEIVEYLEKHVNDHVEIIENLFWELVKEKRGLPAYPEEKIITICRSLKSNGKKETLAKICRIYSDKYPSGNLTKAICDLL